MIDFHKVAQILQVLGSTTIYCLKFIIKYDSNFEQTVSEKWQYSTFEVFTALSSKL